MSNGAVCCILGVCCPPESPSQRVALAQELEHDTGVPMEYCETVAAQILKDYDLAPKGTLQAFKDAIAKMVRHRAQL